MFWLQPQLFFDFYQHFLKQAVLLCLMGSFFFSSSSSSFVIFFWFFDGLVRPLSVVGLWCLGASGSGETNLSLFSVSQQREQRDKAAEMGHRFPGRAGRQPHWSLMLMELLQAANTQPEINRKICSAHTKTQRATITWRASVSLIHTHCSRINRLNTLRFYKI